jgi:hypothetical protein
MLYPESSIIEKMEKLMTGLPNYVKQQFAGYQQNFHTIEDLTSAITKSVTNKEKQPKSQGQIYVTYNGNGGKKRKFEQSGEQYERKKKFRPNNQYKKKLPEKKFNQDDSVKNKKGGGRQKKRFSDMVNKRDSLYFISNSTQNATPSSFPKENNILLCSEKEEKLCRIYGTINNIVTEFVIDSGAVTSVMSHAYMKYLRLKPLYMKKKIILTGFNNESNEINTYVRPAIQLGNITIETSLLIVKNLSCDVIIGIDLLKKLNAKLDFSQNY